MAKRTTQTNDTETAQANYAGVCEVEIIVPNVWAGGVKYLLGDKVTLSADVAELLIKNGQAK